MKDLVPNNDESLERAIDRLYTEMAATDVESEEYAQFTEQLSKLYQLKEIAPPKSKVSPDTLALVFGNLAGIAIIVGHERASIVTSKALSFVSKLR